MRYVFEIFCFSDDFVHFVRFYSDFLFKTIREVGKFTLRGEFFVVVALLFDWVFEANAAILTFWVGEGHLDAVLAELWVFQQHVFGGDVIGFIQAPL